MNDITSEELPNERIIAIDGTSGSGKSTIARNLSAALDLPLLETGSLYRSLTLLCRENDVDVDDEDAVLRQEEQMEFSYNDFPQLGTRNVSEAIRAHDVVMHVSQVSVHEKVRERLTQRMRRWILEQGGGVLEGRDITTVVAPQAHVRLYIDAPEEIRTQRREADPKDNTEGLSIEQIREGLAFRDKLDSTRAASPLTKAEGVWEIDTSVHSLDEIVTSVVDAYQGNN
jgi:cytidylate kinase